MEKLDIALKVFAEDWDGTDSEVILAKCRYLFSDQKISKDIIAQAYVQVFGDDKEQPDFFASMTVAFEVGQVIEHLKYQYLGVIVAVDETFKATDEWYDHMQCASKGVIKEQPWYHVLVHNASHSTYVAQQNLTLSDQKDIIKHPWVSMLFSGFKDKHYIRNDIPWDQL